MATYKKKDKTAKQIRKDRASMGSDSTTKEVFEGLDSGASKAEQWLLKNRKIVLSVIGVAAVVTLGYMGYMRYVKEPAEIKTSNELAYPKAYFDRAQTNSEEADSLYMLALEGADGKYGLLEIAEKYSYTKAGNLANYYAGMAYFKLGDWENAIKYLDEYSSSDFMLSPMAMGTIGDAFSNNNQPEQALNYYEKAANKNSNNYTAPIFLNKAAETAFSLGKFKKAEELYTRIKNEYPQSSFAKDIEGKINAAKYTTE